MISESVASLFSVCEIAIIRAIGDDDEDQRGDHEAGDAEEGQNGLTLARHQVDAAQRLRNPDHAGEADQDQRKRRERRAEDILVDRPHALPHDPQALTRTGIWLSDQSRKREFPKIGQPPLPDGSLSHYHPFDPSTKWLPPWHPQYMR